MVSFQDARDEIVRMSKDIRFVPKFCVMVKISGLLTTYQDIPAQIFFDGAFNT